MLTIQERKRLDELELVADLSGLRGPLHDERSELRDKAKFYEDTARILFAKLLATPVDVVALLDDALDSDAAKVDCKSDLRKALEAVR